MQRTCVRAVAVLLPDALRYEERGAQAGACCTTSAPHPAASCSRDGVPQQSAGGAADPVSRVIVDHVVRPEHLTIEHRMMKPEADNAIATVPKP